MKRPGLTLVELLATMAVLALVLTQAVPAAKNARSESLLAGCKDKLGRIATAGLIYAGEDANEFAVPIGPGDANSDVPYTAMCGFGGKSGLGVDGDARRSPFGGLLELGAMHRPLNTILFKQEFGLPPLKPFGRGGLALDWNRDARLDLDVYHCPADGGFPGMHYAGWKVSGLSGYDYFGTSYAANALFFGFPGNYLKSSSIYNHPVSRVPNPAASILYWEAAARYAMFANNTDLNQSGGCWPYAIQDVTAFGWHGTPYSFVTARVDGHVTWTQIKGYGLSAPLTVVPPGYSEASLTCVKVRAPGWQLDALPAQPVTTHKIPLGIGPGGISIQDGDSDIWAVVPQ